MFLKEHPKKNSRSGHCYMLALHQAKKNKKKGLIAYKLYLVVEKVYLVLATCNESFTICGSYQCREPSVL